MSLYDEGLLEQLSELDVFEHSSSVFRATRRGRDPTHESRGGRWGRPDNSPLLYTSLERDGALAEVSFHLSMLTPAPSKPIVIHTLNARTRNSLKLLRDDLYTLGVTADEYLSTNYIRTQEIGAAISFLGYDGLVVPSARWECDNLILYTDNHSPDDLEIVDSEEFDWLTWAKAHDFL